ncbi:unnamed protein product, partial [marine sediment metagenome]
WQTIKKANHPEINKYLFHTSDTSSRIIIHLISHHGKIPWKCPLDDHIFIQHNIQSVGYKKSKIEGSNLFSYNY